MCSRTHRCGIWWIREDTPTSSLLLGAVTNTYMHVDLYSEICSLHTDKIKIRLPADKLKKQPWGYSKDKAK